MAGISSATGLISGINTSSVIDQLIAIDSRPVTLLQVRISTNQIIQQAYADLQSKLSAINTDVSSLLRPSTFLSASGVSSNTNVLNVTTKATATPGSYSFTVARTVSTQSAISAGYASTSAGLGITGDITVGLGGGKVTSDTNLADLNGGNGVARGTFRITDASGASSSIDISSAVSLDDVVAKINSADNIQVKASVGKNGLVLQDTSGGSGTLKVANTGKTTTATDLGLTAGTTAGTTLTGSAINTVGRNSSLASLNDGLGVRSSATPPVTTGTVTTTGTFDFSIDTGGGHVNQVSLAGVTTVGGAIDAINKNAGGQYLASLGTDGKSLQITNISGSGSISVNSIGGSKAAQDLGIAGTGTTSVQGGALKATLGSVLTKNLEGGSGLALGQLDLRDSAGNAASVFLDGASSLSDVIDAINGAGVGLVASVNKSGTGLQITDTAGGSGTADIESSRGATAAQLGLQGTFAANGTLNGANLQHQYIGENTALSDLNGGKGVSSGTFTITNGKNTTATVNTTGAATLGDLIKAINGASSLNVTASIDPSGNGLLLTDNSGGTGALTVKDTTGTAAANLNIAGTSASGSHTIDGAYSKTVSIKSTDSLTNIVSKLNQAGAGITASILNDGSSTNPNRLSITASNGGLDGQFTLDAGTTDISLSELTSAQNAAVFVGSPTSASPVLVTSSSNTISNVVNGVSLNLVGTSSQPVTVNVTQSSDAAVSALTQFVSDVNTLTATISAESQFSTDPGKKGLLLGDATAQSISDTLFAAVNANITGAGSFTRFAQLGLKIGDDSSVTFDAATFQAAYDKDPQSLQRVFTAFNTVATTTTSNTSGGGTTTTTTTTAFGTDPQGTTVGTDSQTGKAYTKTVKLVGFGIAYQLQNAIGKLIDPVNGTIIRQSAELDSANAQYTDRISDLNTLLDAKRTRLETQFANMESILAGLQTQQSAITGLANSSKSS